jgi:hypothetical protein
MSHVVAIWHSSSANLILEDHILASISCVAEIECVETWFAHITVPVKGILEVLALVGGCDNVL